MTQDPFIVYTSNIFAILSLRALYGFVNTVLGELRFLGPAVALVSCRFLEYMLKKQPLLLEMCIDFLIISGMVNSFRFRGLVLSMP